ncbi:hypothetical protein M404DRAFT_35665 [Pisolithus tinctorius Marx 270]|uniref:Uncharacterized protein n=1 Tax=Pisolithus tinctorius Marx 270 TaxID=870435 RepID=A0A0C3NEB4_PISTI|nr:hypothetical protein M404DRAFT_35665 [Pisolithus tinctorius Marx 270]
MSTYNAHVELENAAKSILEIIESQVNGLRDFADKPRFVAWKAGVRAVAAVVDSVHKIACITQQIPLTLIAAEKFCKWHERVGYEREGHLFPKWRQITHPEKADLAGHLWLQSIEERVHSTHAGTSMAPIPPTPKPKSAKLSKVASQKGKEKASAAEVEQMTQVDDRDGEGKGVDKDVEMVGHQIHEGRARGLSITNERAASTSHLPSRESRTPRPKVIKQEMVEEDKEDELDDDEDLHVALDAGQPGTSTHLQPHSTAPAITAPPKSTPGRGPCDTCVRHNVTCTPRTMGSCAQCKHCKICCSQSDLCPSKGSTPGTSSGQNRSCACSKKWSRSTTTPSDDKQLDKPDRPAKKPHQTPAVTPIPKSCPVVLIPQGRPVICLPARPAWTTSQVLPAQPQQCLQPTHTAMPGAGPSRTPQSSMITAHEQNAAPSTRTPQSAPTPQLQPPTLFKVDMRNELNQLFFFHKSISVQMVEVKKWLNAMDSHRQAAMPGLVEDRMKLDCAIRAIEALCLQVVGHTEGPPDAIENSTTAMTALPPPDEESMDGMEGLGSSAKGPLSRSVSSFVVDEVAGVVVERQAAGIEEHLLDSGPCNEDLMVDWDGGQEQQEDSAGHPMTPSAIAVAPLLHPQTESNVDQPSTEEPQQH